MKVYAVVARWENPSDGERQCSIEGICSNEKKAEAYRQKRLEHLTWTDTMEIDVEEYEVDGFEHEKLPISESLMQDVKEKLNEDS